MNQKSSQLPLSSLRSRPWNPRNIKISRLLLRDHNLDGYLKSFASHEFSNRKRRFFHLDFPQQISRCLQVAERTFPAFPFSVCPGLRRYPVRHSPTDNTEASNIASNSDVPAAYMVGRVYNAALSSFEELLTELEKVYLLGQSQKETFTETVEYAVACQNICAISNLFKVDVSRTRHLTEKDVDVNAVGPNVINRAIQGERTDVDILRLFLDRGLDVRKLFGNQGDALMWAVRIGRWELIERILDQKGSFDVDEVKVSQSDRDPRSLWNRL